jgi:predicted deacylase
MTIDSGQAGPTVWLVAGLHGDEMGGSVIVQEVFKQLASALKAGKVYAIPLANTSGFENASRHLGGSEEDLNRAFPGSIRGTLAQRIANKIFSRIIKTKPDFVLDLHNDWTRSIPYALIDHDLQGDVKDVVLRRAINTCLPIIEDTDVITGSLSHNLTRHNIPTLVLELGEALVVNEENITVGVRSVMNVLYHMKMTKKPRTQEAITTGHDGCVVFKYSGRPFASTSGIIRFFKSPGERVENDEVIARIYNVFGVEIEEIRSLASGIVLGLSDNAVAFPGASIMAFGNY